MILLIDLCYEEDSLSKYEFVLPIESALEQVGAKCEIFHYTKISNDVVQKCEKIILCGTALKDDIFVRNLKTFHWLGRSVKPILGICAGMQVIGSIFGGSIISERAIGLKKIDIIHKTDLLGEPRQMNVYHLHNEGVNLPKGFDLVAGDPSKVEAFKHRRRPIYGIIFHPEVRNKWIFERFVRIPGNRSLFL
jgi:GMP synthase-like glutamine amidotransferase